MQPPANTEVVCLTCYQEFNYWPVSLGKLTDLHPDSLQAPVFSSHWKPTAYPKPPICRAFGHGDLWSFIPNPNTKINMRERLTYQDSLPSCCSHQTVFLGFRKEIGWRLQVWTDQCHAAPHRDISHPPLSFGSQLGGPWSGPSLLISAFLPHSHAVLITGSA